MILPLFAFTQHILNTCTHNSCSVSWFKVILEIQLFENFLSWSPISHHPSASACKFHLGFLLFLSPLAIILWHRCEHSLATPQLRVHYSAEIVKVALKLWSLKTSDSIDERSPFLKLSLAS